MKKITVLVLMFLFLISSGVMAQNQGYFQAQIGADLFGEIDVENYGDQDTDAGISLIGEYKVPMNNSPWTFGGGITYQLEREEDADYLASEFDFTSFYGLAQYDIVDNPLYFIGKLGYSTFNLDMPIGAVNNYFGTNVSYDESGGMFYGIGAGYTFGEKENYVFEFLYSVNKGEVELSDQTNKTTMDFDYSKFTASIGMKF
jgi:hypothetical protein